MRDLPNSFFFLLSLVKFAAVAPSSKCRWSRRRKEVTIISARKWEKRRKSNLNGKCALMAPKEESQATKNV